MEMSTVKEDYLICQTCLSSAKEENKLAFDSPRRRLTTRDLHTISNNGSLAREQKIPTPMSNIMRAPTEERILRSFTIGAYLMNTLSVTSILSNYLFTQTQWFSTPCISILSKNSSLNPKQLLYMSQRFPCVLRIYLYVVACIAGNQNKFIIHNS